MKTLSLLIKPASGLCNIKCSYCFYREELSHLQGVRPGIMSDEVLELLIQRACESAEDTLQITFQGGEPALAGLDFYRKFTELLRKTKKRNLRVSYSFQTNGLLLDEDWCAFFQENHFLVGLSFDGTADLHDRYRTDANGKGTSAQVLAAWQLLRQNRVDTNLLCVVTKQAAKRPGRIYHFMRDLGAEFLQYIPCMDFRTDIPVGQSLALAPADYAYFLKGLFDLWYQDWERGDYVSIRQFDDYLLALGGRRPNSCSACGECGAYLVAEHDGSVYPCDFYVEDRYCLGNIKEASFEELRYGENMKQFLQTPYKGSRCSAGICRFYALCRGGCRRDSVTAETCGQKDYANRYCEAYQDFFQYALPRMQKAAQSAGLLR
ncbi:MAG: anaerobic sulfatase maturase [Lachnospiraceae bacterium]|nr:anaerobic sulfatase maturase [Lachnospiraceae bacterium]